MLLNKWIKKLINENKTNLRSLPKRKQEASAGRMNKIGNFNMFGQF
jgi:hypothetical protein